MTREKCDKESQKLHSSQFPFSVPLPTPPSTLPSSDESEEDQDEARGPSGSGVIQAKTLSLLQRKQHKPQSMITWGKESGGPLNISLTPLQSSTPRIESEEESYLWSLTVLQLKDRLREKAMPVSGVKAALVARLMEAPVMEAEGRKDAPR